MFVPSAKFEWRTDHNTSLESGSCGVRIERRALEAAGGGLQKLI